MAIPYTIPEFTIAYKSNLKPDLKMKMVTSADTSLICREIFDADSIEWVESMAVIALNRANVVLGFYKVSQGGVTGTVCDPKVIIQFALLSNASSIILAHNHPSGNTKPSREDIELTSRIKQASELFNIKLLDHLIVTSTETLSMAEDGLM